ncbi:ABC transporter permease [Bailinhaonella thermotolerans]|uniref:Transport permease protein n=2 Tax=Bailinhaonella thermotolerans TaxID=1070861 RepID=A0A3A4BSW8_9ACTN|nr:ABC transporter permease [Bailinhaonella thermotolerans]
MVWAQTRLNQTVLLRMRGMAFSVLLLPLFLAFSFTSGPQAEIAIDGVPGSVFAAVGAIAVVFPFSYMTIATSIVVRREERIYKRLRGTALPTSAIFAGDVLHATLIGAAQALVILAYTMVAADVPLPANIPLLLVAFVLGAAVFAALAIGTAGFIPNYEVAQIVALPVLLLSMFGSGMVIPLHVLPEELQRPAELLPLTPIVSMLRTAFLGRDFSQDAAPQVGLFEAFQVSAASLGIALVWIGLSMWSTRKYFRWDPRRA